MATIDETASKPAASNGQPAAPAQKTAEAAPAAEPALPAKAKAAGKGVIAVKVPTIGESISEVTLLKWLKKDGDLVRRDDVLAELESEKATFELNAEESGRLSTTAKEGDVIRIGDTIGNIDTDVAVPEQAQPAAASTPPATVEQKSRPAATATAAAEVKATPVAAAIIADKKIDPKSITASGTAGRIVKGDVLAALANPGKKAFDGQELFSRNQRREKMTSLRKTISRRLVESKNTTAMLTTFNEVDMTRIMEIRKLYKDKFKETHGVGLGFMSFFAKACAISLSEWPAVNGYIDGEELVYHDYADISIAVSTPRGLTVPVIRNVESMSMADIEKKVIELAGKARDNKLSMEELQGGTFTITNGGVFGSLMSTPIINLPQSAILGMHKIQERPMAVNGQVVIRPMMYIALSYDHRIIDGRESVSFLVRVKELLENPEMLLIGKDPVRSLLEL
jgi:2-oxoglutarate dehydrogenase E2 component (dihydrolipoamide succinyltransferase)